MPHLNRKGQGLVEYIVLICLVAVALFTVVHSMGTKTKAKFSDANDMIDRL